MMLALKLAMFWLKHALMSYLPGDAYHPSLCKILRWMRVQCLETHFWCNVSCVHQLPLLRSAKVDQLVTCLRCIYIYIYICIFLFQFPCGDSIFSSITAYQPSMIQFVRTLIHSLYRRPSVPNRSKTNPHPPPFTPGNTDARNGFETMTWIFHCIQERFDEYQRLFPSEVAKMESFQKDIVTLSVQDKWNSDVSLCMNQMAALTLLVSLFHLDPKPLLHTFRDCRSVAVNWLLPNPNASVRMGQQAQDMHWILSSLSGSCTIIETLCYARAGKKRRHIARTRAKYFEPALSALILCLCSDGKQPCRHPRKEPHQCNFNTLQIEAIVRFLHFHILLHRQCQQETNDMSFSQYGLVYVIVNGGHDYIGSTRPLRKANHANKLTFGPTLRLLVVTATL